MYRLLRPDRFALSFYGWTQADKFLMAYRAAGFRVVGHLVFCKPYASSRRYLAYRHEQAYLLAKGNPPLPLQPISDVRDWQYSGNRFHPTEKPVSALLPLAQAFSSPGQLVLDPFCGSGSSLVAAKMSNRRYLGIELDSTYAATADYRLRQRLN